MQSNQEIFRSVENIGFDFISASFLARYKKALFVFFLPWGFPNAFFLQYTPLPFGLSSLFFLFMSTKIPLESRRGQGRIAAMKFLFEMEFHGEQDLDERMKDFFLFQRIKDGIAGYARTLIEGSFSHRKQLDAILTDNLQNWTLSRLSRVDRNILRLGVFELLYVDDVPSKVTLNEMVELAKSFGNTDSGSFVNGVLDAVRRKLAQRDTED